MLFDHSQLSGYTKPISHLTLENRIHLVHALSVHYGLLVVKAEIDQFKEGLLSVMSFLMEIQKHQELFVKVFTCAGEQPLTAGKYL